MLTRFRLLFRLRMADIRAGSAHRTAVHHIWTPWTPKLQPKLRCADGVGPAANAGGGGSIGIGVLGMVMLAQTVYVSELRSPSATPMCSFGNCRCSLKLLTPRCFALHTYVLSYLAAIYGLSTVDYTANGNWTVASAH